MTVEQPIARRLDRFFPTDTIRVEDERHSVESYIDGSGTEQIITEYTLRKAPFDRLLGVSAVVDGVRVDLSIGEDVTAVDGNGDGELDQISLDVEPDPDTDIFVDYKADPLLTRVTGTLDEDRIELSERINQSIDNKQVKHATGQELDLNGDWFGLFGDRFGRSDAEYRAILLGTPPAFKGRGTITGLRQALSTGVNADPSDITITEDFQQNGFEITVKETGAIVSGGLIDLVEQASPTGVELLSAPNVQTAGEKLQTTFDGASVTASASSAGSLDNGTLGGGTLT